MKKVYFVRHGETEGNLGGYYQSSTTTLSDSGHKGAAAVASRFATIKIDVLISSAFVRAHQTAENISKVVQQPVTTFNDFHEILQSEEVHGKKFDSSEALLYMEERKENFTNPTWNRGGAENYFDVIKRVKRCVAMLEDNKSENILLVSHGHFLRALIAYLLLGKKDDIETNITVYHSLLRMSNVGITQFTFEEGKWKLFTWNDHAHFAE